VLYVGGGSYPGLYHGLIPPTICGRSNKLDGIDLTWLELSVACLAVGEAADWLVGWWWLCVVYIRRPHAGPWIIRATIHQIPYHQRHHRGWTLWCAIFYLPRPVAPCSEWRPDQGFSWTCTRARSSLSQIAGRRDPHDKLIGTALVSLIVNRLRSDSVILYWHALLFFRAFLYFQPRHKCFVEKTVRYKRLVLQMAEATCAGNFLYSPSRYVCYKQNAAVSRECARVSAMCNASFYARK